MIELKIADSSIATYVLLLNTSDIIYRHAEIELSGLGITPTQFRILVALQTFQKSPTLTDLEKMLFRSRKGLTTVIGRMEKAGLVKREKDKNDGRAIRVVTTSKGQQLFEKVRQPSRNIVFRVMSCFNQEEINLLSELLQRMRKHTIKELVRNNGCNLATGLDILKETRVTGVDCD